MHQRPVARWWALGVLAVAWNAPWVARQFVDFPLASVWASVSVVLAVAAVTAWLVPGLRRAVFVPGDAEHHAGGQVAAAAIGLVAAAVFLLLLGSQGALQVLE